MNLRVHELKKGNISQFSIFPIICINKIITIEKLVTLVSAKYHAITEAEIFMLFELTKRDISYKNIFEHNNSF